MKDIYKVLNYATVCRMGDLVDIGVCILAIAIATIGFMIYVDKCVKTNKVKKLRVITRFYTILVIGLLIAAAINLSYTTRLMMHFSVKEFMEYLIGKDLIGTVIGQ